MKATLLPSGLGFEAAAGLSLLEAAEAGGIELPSSCRNGTCRTCLCRLVDGRIRWRIEWPGVSAEEKAEGWILACVAEPEGDITLEAPQAFSVFQCAAPGENPPCDETLPASSGAFPADSAPAPF
jgi:ferredoxin